MGHRQDLLEGAKQCIYERGYARTTARDIVAASGTNLASIGYHFGSKEALLNAAILEASGDLVDRALESRPLDPDASPIERLEGVLQAMVDSFDQNRLMWLASVEAFAQAERVPEVRAQFAAGHEEGRVGLAALVLQVDDKQIDDATARTLGSLLMALVSGMALQRLVDPKRAPTGHDLAAGLRQIADMIEAGR